MNSFSVQEILEYAERLEIESRKFYKQAAQLLKGAAEQTALKLAEDETEHAERIRQFMGRAGAKFCTVNLGEPALKHEVKIKTGTTEHELLEIALSRELATEKLYNTLATLTDLDADISKLFEDLHKQEQLHAKIIKERINLDNKTK